MKPEDMYLLEYLIYQLRPFRLEPAKRPPTPEPPPDVDETALILWFLTDKNNIGETGPILDTVPC